MFFDAFVESKRTRNIRYQLPIRVFLWFQKLFSNSTYYLRSFCYFLPEWLFADVLWISAHFLRHVLALLRRVFILSHILKFIKCTRPYRTIRENISNMFVLWTVVPNKINTVWYEAINVTRTLCQFCWRKSWCIFTTTAYSKGVTGVITWPTWHTKIR
jgi:hypothetical protein